MAQGGGKGAGILILLVLLAGLGGYNYHHNYQLEKEQQGSQPFAGYDDASLEALAAAYESEIAVLQKQYDALKGRRAQVRSTHGVGDGVREFERVQAGSHRLRNVTEELATREARNREIRHEQRYRARLGRGLVLHFERLTGVTVPM